jgi:DNA invertase Pin-like site-specific DNA recombinase
LLGSERESPFLRAAIYTRVSTADQNPELQLRELHEYATRQGWQITDTYQDIISLGNHPKPAIRNHLKTGQR